MNTYDYRKILFKKEYGFFSLISVPAGFVSMVAVPYILGLLMFQIVKGVYNLIEKYQTIGFDFGWTFSLPKFDSFFMNTNAYVFTGILLYILVMTTIVIGQRMITGKYRFDFRIIYFMLIFSFVAPLWVVKAMYNAVFAKKTAWR